MGLLSRTYSLLHLEVEAYIRGGVDLEAEVEAQVEASIKVAARVESMSMVYLSKKSGTPFHSIFADYD